MKLKMGVVLNYSHFFCRADRSNMSDRNYEQRKDCEAGLIIGIMGIIGIIGI